MIHLGWVINLCLPSTWSRREMGFGQHSPKFAQLFLEYLDLPGLEPSLPSFLLPLSWTLSLRELLLQNCEIPNNQNASVTYSRLLGGWAQGCGSVAAASAHRMKFCHVGQEILCLKWRNSRVAWQMAWTAGWVKNWGLDEINL